MASKKRSKKRSKKSKRAKSPSPPSRWVYSRRKPDGGVEIVKVKITTLVKAREAVSVLKMRVRRAESLAEAYGEQLDEIGKILVARFILTKKEVERDGVRFALKSRYGTP